MFQKVTVNTITNVQVSVQHCSGSIIERVDYISRPMNGENHVNNIT